MDDGTLLKVSCPAETWRPRTADQVGKDTKLLDLQGKFMLKFIQSHIEKIKFSQFFRIKKFDKNRDFLV
jgi:hypothetical protein